MNLLRSTLSLAVALTLTAFTQAQVTELTGTGCPNAPAVAVSGPPRINTTIDFSWRCAMGDLPIIFFGEVLRPPIALPRAITCGSAVCTLAVTPMVLIQGAVNSPLVVQVAIPNNPGLVSAIVGVQGGCVSRQPLCLGLGTAIAVRVMR
jgi:hypothetical protein